MFLLVSSDATLKVLADDLSTARRLAEDTIADLRTSYPDFDDGAGMQSLLHELMSEYFIKIQHGEIPLSTKASTQDLDYWIRRGPLEEYDVSLVEFSAREKEMKRQIEELRVGVTGLTNSVKGLPKPDGRVQQGERISNAINHIREFQTQDEELRRRIDMISGDLIRLENEAYRLDTSSGRFALHPEKSLLTPTDDWVQEQEKKRSTVDKKWLEFLAQKYTNETRVFLEKLSDKSMKDELSRLHTEASRDLTPKDSVDRLPIPENWAQQQEKEMSTFSKEQNDVLELLVADNKEIRGRLKNRISNSIRFKNNELPCLDTEVSPMDSVKSFPTPDSWVQQEEIKAIKSVSRI